MIRSSHNCTAKKRLTEVESHLDEFKKLFLALKKRTLKELRKNSVNAEELYDHVILLPEDIKDEHIKLFDTKGSELEDAADSGHLGHLFSTFSNYPSYIDFSLLEHIIEEFGSDSLKESMKQYAQRLAEFRKKYTLSDIFPHLPQSSNPPTTFSKMEWKTEIDIKTCTLETINEYRRRFGNEFLLSHWVILLGNMKEGCLLLTWFIPSVLVGNVNKHIRTSRSTVSEQMREMKIVRITIDDRDVYLQAVSYLYSCIPLVKIEILSKILMLFCSLR